MARNDDKKSDSQADFEETSKRAERLGLKGRDRAKYVHDHMTGYGYKMVPSYVSDDDEEEERPFFGGRRKRNRRDDDDDDGYPF